MSKKGGYKIIDFKGIELEDGNQESIPGIYETIESTNKKCLVSGLVFEGIEYNDFPALFLVDAMEFVASVPLLDEGEYLRIRITADDIVEVFHISAE